MDQPLSQALPLPDHLLSALGEALRGIRYGSIELVIHDGRVVQLERREKVRFDIGVTASRRTIAAVDGHVAATQEDRPDHRTSATQAPGRSA